jgi:hypothetical protein
VALDIEGSNPSTHPIPSLFSSFSSLPALVDYIEKRKGPVNESTGPYYQDNLTSLCQELLGNVPQDSFGFFDDFLHQVIHLRHILDALCRFAGRHKGLFLISVENSFD